MARQHIVVGTLEGRIQKVKGKWEERAGSYNPLLEHASDVLTSSHLAPPAEGSAASQLHHGLGALVCGGHCRSNTIRWFQPQVVEVLFLMLISYGIGQIT